MHPSYEDRPGAPDVVFAKVGDHDFERIVATWRAALERAGAADADLLHLNHLTPIHEAAIRYFPDVPRAGHLHGTELLMLGEIANGAIEIRRGVVQNPKILRFQSRSSSFPHAKGASSAAR